MPKWGLTAISSLESALKKIFRQLVVHHVYKVGINLFLGSGCENESNSQTRSSRREENFSWTRRTWCVESWNQTFFGSGCQNESNSHHLSRIGEKKIFHEVDVHHVYKVGITCFWALDAKMSLTAMNSLQLARRKFFMNSTYIMSTK